MLAEDPSTGVFSADMVSSNVSAKRLTEFDCYKSKAVDATGLCSSLPGLGNIWCRTRVDTIRHGIWVRSGKIQRTRRWMTTQMRRERKKNPICRDEREVTDDSRRKMMIEEGEKFQIN